MDRWYHLREPFLNYLEKFHKSDLVTILEDVPDDDEHHYAFSVQ